MRLGAIVLTATMTAGVVAPAWACAPLVNLPYSNVREHQEWMWVKAESVVIVRLVEFLKPDPALSAEQLRQRRLDRVKSERVTLEPVRWLKGQGSMASFRMPRGGTGDCIPTSGWDADVARAGDTFVAYFRLGPLSGETLMGGLVPADIVAPDMEALMASSQ